MPQFPCLLNEEDSDVLEWCPDLDLLLILMPLMPVTSCHAVN